MKDSIFKNIAEEYITEPSKLRATEISLSPIIGTTTVGNISRNAWSSSEVARIFSWTAFITFK
jgi:hypothetical protein